MNKFLPAGLCALALTLAACTVYDPAPEPLEPVTPPSAMVAIESSSSSSAEPVVETKTVVLVDQSYETARGVTGAARLRAMKTVKLGGNIKNAKLKFVLSRNGQNDGVDGVTVYSADLDDVGNIVPSTEWKRFRAVGGAWLGRGHCRFSLENDLIAGSGETVEAEYLLSEFPVSSGQPECTDEVLVEDFETRINTTGIVLGFLPTNQGYHLTVTMTYEGNLTMKPW